MHSQSPPLTIGRTVLKESGDLVILEVTFDSKLTFEKHIRLVSREASQRLGIVRKYWPVFHDRSLLETWFWGFVLPVVEYCSAVWCSAKALARLPIHTLNYCTVQSLVPVPNRGCVLV